MFGCIPLLILSSQIISADSGMHVPSVGFGSSSIQYVRYFYQSKIVGKCSQFVVQKEMDYILPYIATLESSSILIRTSDRILSQNIFDYDDPFIINGTTIYKYCRTLTILSNNPKMWERWLDNSNPSTLSRKRLYPFNNVVIVSIEKPKLAAQHWDYVFINLLQVYWIQLIVESTSTGDGTIEFNRIVHFPTQNELVLNETLEPTFNKRLRTFLTFGKPYNWKSYHVTKSIRASQFNCTPYVIPRYNSSGAVYKYDGVESLFLTEITKHWTFDAVNVRHVQDGYDLTLDSMAENQSDIAVCGIWLSISVNQPYDCSVYFDHMCGTFLVPSPYILNADTNIFLSFTPDVWMATMGSFVLAVLSLTIISNLNYSRSDPAERRPQMYSDWVRSSLDLAAISVMQNVSMARDRAPVKYVLVSWILLCLVLGAVYSTGYTALLSSPRYSTPIDTLDDFIANDLVWGIIIPGREHFKELNLSLVLNYRKLYESAFDEIDVDERLRNMATNDRYAVFVKVQYNRFVTDILNIFDASLRMRLMKSCFYNQYTTLVLQKHSPYTEYVNEHITRFRESGIFQFWATETRTILSQRVRKFFVKEQFSTHVGTPLNLVNISGAFELLCFGLGLGVLVFIAERYRLTKLLFDFRDIIKCIYIKKED